MARRTSEQIADTDDQITLGLLNAVKDNHALTQRSAAKELGVALGLVNAYLKRCIKKGLIKVQQVPSNRYAYYLTPQGFAEKSRLTAEFLNQSLSLFRQAQRDFEDELSACQTRGWKTVALCGMSDLVDVIRLYARDYPVTIVGVVSDAGPNPDCDLPVAESLEALGAVDAVIVTDLTWPQKSFDRIITMIDPDRVLTPAFLEVHREPLDADREVAS